MDCVIVHAIAIGIIFPTTGRTHLVIEHPCTGVVSLDGGLHVEHTGQHISQITIKALDIGVVANRHCVLVGV